MLPEEIGEVLPLLVMLPEKMRRVLLDDWYTPLHTVIAPILVLMVKFGKEAAHELIFDRAVTAIFSTTSLAICIIGASFSHVSIVIIVGSSEADGSVSGMVVSHSGIPTIISSVIPLSVVGGVVIVDPVVFPISGLEITSGNGGVSKFTHPDDDNRVPLSVSGKFISVQPEESSMSDPLPAVLPEGISVPLLDSPSRVLPRDISSPEDVHPDSVISSTTSCPQIPVSIAPPIIEREPLKIFLLLVNAGIVSVVSNLL